MVVSKMLGVVVQVHPYGPGGREEGMSGADFHSADPGRETEKLTSGPAKLARQNFRFSPRHPGNPAE